MSLYQQSVVQMSKMLRNLDACLTKAVAFAEAKGSAADDFVGARLTFDMRPLAFQIQSACDTAKFTAARLSAGEAPAHEDKEATMAELSARIQATLDYLDGVEESAFEGAAKREVTLSFLPGQGIEGANYLREMALPNFYFHVVTAYAILRAAGVGIGKRDFIGSLTLYPLGS